MNDIKLLDFAGLARTFQQTYQQLYAQQLQQSTEIARRKHQHALRTLAEQISTGESGSDGVEEAATEILGDFDPKKVQLTTPQLQQLRTEAKAHVCEQWAQQAQIAQKLSWLPHQLMAYFGTWQAVRDPSGQYSALETWDLNTRQRADYHALGSGLLATSARTNFFKDAPKGNQQYKSPINPLVPIILAGFKKYQNIPYSKWSLTGLEALLDPELAKLVGVQAPPISTSELIALRNTAVTDKTGPRAGIPNNPATCTKLNHLSDTVLGHLPKLAKYMLLQTWACHPTNRHEYMILDLNNWDNMPEPLISKDIFSVPAKITQPAVGAEAADLPWLA